MINEYLNHEMYYRNPEHYNERVDIGENQLDVEMCNSINTLSTNFFSKFLNQ
jgi:hypothetical protein